MRITQILHAVGVCAASTVVAACSTSWTPRSSVAQLARPLQVIPPRAPVDKLYVGVGSGSYSEVVYGYRLRQGHLKEICSVPGVTQAASVSADARGRLLVPDGVAKSVTVFNGPGLCESELGSLTDSYGQPVDASSIDAATGVIAVANIFDTSGARNTLKPGSISVCTLSAGCKTNLTNPNMFELCCVLLARNGDCWASALNHSITAGTLTYFRGCSGAGRAATGYKGPGYGSLDIDSHGNLVAVSWTPYYTDLYVYRGCDPRCSLVGGPLRVKNHGFSGHLNASGTTWASADYHNTTIDVYAYTPTKLTYEYTFSVGSQAAERVAFSPRSK